MTRTIPLVQSPTDVLQAALALHADGDHLAACTALERLVQQTPHFAPARNALGVVLLAVGRVDDAVRVLDMLARAAPRVASVQVNLGNALAAARRFPAAIAAFRRAIALELHSPGTLYGFARVLQLSGDASAAADAYGQSLLRDPQQVEAWANLAAALNFLDRYDEGVTAARRALRLDPQHAGAHFNLAVALLSTDRLAEGWAEFEWRSRTTLLQGVSAPSSAPLWDGRVRSGETLLVWAEQGFGDTLQFVRWLRTVRERGQRVVLLCQRPLVRLLHAQRLADAVLPLGATLPTHHAHCSLSSLPHRLRLHDADSLCVSSAPYFRRTTPSTPRGPGEPLRIGVVWAGHPTHVNDQHRSIGLSPLKPLLEVPGVAWVRLQVGPRARDQESLGVSAMLHDGTGRTGDFAETARALEALDLVITVDSAVAHLAGAMGVPTWLLLPRIGLDWRWLVGGAPQPFARSPWYASVQYVRQESAGDWATTIESVRAALTALVSARSAPPATR